MKSPCRSLSQTTSGILQTPPRGPYPLPALDLVIDFNQFRGAIDPVDTVKFFTAFQTSIINFLKTHDRNERVQGGAIVFEQLELDFYLTELRGMGDLGPTLSLRTLSDILSGLIDFQRVYGSYECWFTVRVIGTNIPSFSGYFVDLAPGGANANQTEHETS